MRIKVNLLGWLLLLLVLLAFGCLGYIAYEMMTNAIQSSSIAYLVVLIIFIGFLFITAAVVGFSRFLNLRSSLANIPRDYVPITAFEIPKNVAELLSSEIAKCSSSVADFEPVESQPAAIGYGNGDFKDIHFKTNIAKSFILLEQKAVGHNPDWAKPTSYSVRQYVESLAEEIAIHPKACAVYLEMYEKARFGFHEFTESEYREFTRSFVVLSKGDACAMVDGCLNNLK